MEYTSDFTKDVVKPGKVLVIFSAPWCVPCKALEPILNKLALKHSVVKVNVDTDPKVAEHYTVISVPTAMLFENGAPLIRAKGKLDEAILTNLLAESTPPPMRKK